MSLLTSAIPLPYRILGIVVIFTMLTVGSAWYGYTKGSARADVVIAQYTAAKAALANSIQEIQVKVVDRIITQYVDKVRVIHDSGAHNEQIANNVVPDKQQLSNGWVYTHDASAAGRNADATGSADATPSGVEANQALGTVVNNYSGCQETRQQLISLQNWVIDTKRNIDEQNAKNKKSR